MPVLFRVLGLDPSTTITGVALVTFDRSGPRTVEMCSEVGSAAHSGERFARIAAAADSLDEFLGPFGKDDFSVAYETPIPMRDGSQLEKFEAMHNAIGAFLTVPVLRERTLYPVAPATAKSVWGGTYLKSAEAKAGVVAWAGREFGVSIAPEQHHMADALAVCVAAWAKWRAAYQASLQTTMFNKKVGRAA